MKCPLIFMFASHPIENERLMNFWGAFNSLYNNIKPPSWLAPGTDFHLFKEGIEPKWEDPVCEAGGKWTVPVPKGPTSKQVLDMMWLNAVSQMLLLCFCRIACEECWALLGIVQLESCCMCFSSFGSWIVCCFCQRNAFCRFVNCCSSYWLPCAFHACDCMSECRQGLMISPQ